MSTNQQRPSSLDNDPFWHPRQMMVKHQLENRGIVDSRVLEVMRTVPREEFVPASLQGKAYEDRPLPIGLDQTISQPLIVALMAEALELDGSEKVLEIGTGSGYQAAVLSCLAHQVFTIERLPELGENARETLSRLGYRNVEVRIGDGTLGIPEEAPFDAIVVTAGGNQLPQPLADQLAEGGRIVIPTGAALTSQHLYRYRREGRKLRREDLGGVAFVPLIGAHGWALEE